MNLTQNKKNKKPMKRMKGWEDKELLISLESRFVIICRNWIKWSECHPRITEDIRPCNVICHLYETTYQINPKKCNKKHKATPVQRSLTMEDTNWNVSNERSSHSESSVRFVMDVSISYTTPTALIHPSIRPSIRFAICFLSSFHVSIHASLFP